MEIASCRHLTYNRLSRKIDQIGGQITVWFNGMWPCMMSMFASSIYIYTCRNNIYIYTCRNFHVHKIYKIYDHGHPWNSYYCLISWQRPCCPNPAASRHFFFSSTIKARLSWTSRVGKIGNGDHLKDPLENNRNTTNHQICWEGREYPTLSFLVIKPCD